MKQTQKQDEVEDEKRVIKERSWSHENLEFELMSKKPQPERPDPINEDYKQLSRLITELRQEILHVIERNVNINMGKKLVDELNKPHCTNSDKRSEIFMEKCLQYQKYVHEKIIELTQRVNNYKSIQKTVEPGIIGGGKCENITKKTKPYIERTYITFPPSN